MALAKRAALMECQTGKFSSLEQIWPQVTRFGIEAGE
jgi:hypothetical protein